MITDVIGGFIASITGATLAPGAYVVAQPQPWFQDWGYYRLVHPGRENYFDTVYGGRPYDVVPGDIDPEWHLKKDSASRKAAIARFYTAGVLHRQVKEGAMSVLEVGPGFYNLNYADQVRLMKMLDAEYNILGSGYRLIELRDWHSKHPIGHFTVEGLQLI